MKVMVIVKASRESEAEEMCSPEMFAAMDKFNEELINAGIMLDGTGLTPTSRGARVRFSGSKRTVTAGSWRSRYELSSRVSKFDTGVSAAHEYGITR